MPQDEEVVNADLLALADDDDESDSDASDTKPSSRRSRSPSSARSPPPRRMKSPPSRRRSSGDEDAEGSAAESLGSGAMSESESDAPPTTAPNDGSSFPVEGRFKSEAERTRIMALPEVERESFLADRSEEIQQAAQSLQLRQLMASRAKQDIPQKKRKADSAERDEAPRKRTAKTKTAEKIANYKRAREEKNELRQRPDDQKPRGRRSPSRSNSRSVRDDKAESEDVEWDDGRRRSSPPRSEPPPSLHEFQRVRIGRTNFAEVCFYPGFEAAMKGCFCRVAIGPSKNSRENQYRMTQIKGFTTGREYKMEAPKNGRPFKTTQYVILAHGKAEKEWPFIACSDSHITPAEYERYLSALRAENLRTAGRAFLDTKCHDITNLLNRSWTEAEITEKLERQKAAWVQPTGPTAYTDSTPDLRTSTAGHSNGVNNSSPAPLTQAQRLAALNTRNRRANAEEIRKAQIAERKRAMQMHRPTDKGEPGANGAGAGDGKLKAPVDDLFGNSDASRAATPLPAEKNGANETNGKKPSKPVKKRMMDDDVLGELDFGIEIEV